MKSFNYILSKNSENDYVLQKNIAIVINLFYYNDIEKYFNYIKKIPKKIDVYLFSSDEKILTKALESITERQVECCKKDNRGRDLSALLVGFREKTKNYDYLCFVHDKANKYEHKEADIDKWVENLWGNMLETESYIYNVLELLDSTNLGILVPPEPIGEYVDAWYTDVWFHNKENTVKLAGKLGIKFSPNDEDRLSLGSVFWCKTDALRKIFNYPWKYEDFPDEPMENDGQISHAIERLFGYAAQDAGYDMGVVMNETYAEWLLEVSQEKLKKTYNILWEKWGIKNTCVLDNLSVENKVINEFYEKNHTVYIYGAGDYAKSYIKRLKYFGKEPVGFIVSDGHRKENELLGYPVYELREIQFKTNIGIIIAANYGLQIKIKNNLDELGFHNYILANFK